MGAALTAYLLQNVVIGYYREIFELKNLDFAVPEHINRKTMEKILSLSVGQHISTNSAVKESVASQGQHALTTLAYTIVYEVFPIAVQVIFMIAALLYLSWPLGLVVIAGMALFVGAIIAGNLKIQGPLKEIEKKYHENSRFRSEVYRNAELVLVNNQERRAVRENVGNLRNVHMESQNIWLNFMKWAFARNIVVGLTRFAVMAIGAHYVYSGVYTPGYLVIFWSWSGNALSQVGTVGQLQRRIVEMYASVKKYFELLDIEPSVKIIPNPVRPEKFFGRIEFRNVTFEYPERRKIPDEEAFEEKNPKKQSGPALQGASFIIEPGQTVAFVGESGAGKTTAVHALLRAEDVKEGQIVVDGNDIRILDLGYFRESMGLVEQNVPLFDATLRYNITYATNGAADKITKEKLDQIAEMACIDRFYDRLEKGYDTLIGERGVRLSGGERQRVGIARALIKEPDILIFDEATSNLDSQNEAFIRLSIEKAARGRTTIIIAHRFSTIRSADKIVVFDKGRVVGEGTHDKLMLACPEYQRLVFHQMNSTTEVM